MFKEEHGAGDWGTDKLTSKYLKDTPGQEDAIVKSKKVVLKKKAVEEEKPAETKNKVMPDNKGYAERRAAAKKAKQDKMDRMVRARLAGGPPRKNRGAFWKREKSVGESVEVVESDKAEYNKLMDKYGDMPMSKVPMKARLRIRELGRSVRGDKGGPTAGDLVKSMKRRRMGEEVEQVDEAVDGWIAMYNGKKVEIKKSEAKDLYAAKLKAIQMLKVPKSKQGLLAIKPAVNEEVEQVDEVKSKAARMMMKDKAARRRGEREVDSVIKQSPEDQKQREKNIQKGIDRMVQLGKDVKAGRKPKMSPARAKLHGEEVEHVDESEYGSIGDRVKRKLRKPGGLADRHDNRVARKSSSPEKRDGAVQRMADRRGKRGPMDHDSSKWHSDEKLRSKVRKSAGVNEEVEVAEAGMIGRTKPSRELNVQKDEKPHLAGVKSLKYQKRAAHKAERKKGKQDVKINPELDETVERAKRGVDMAKQRVLAAKQRVARAKARDLGQKRREMRNEDSEIEEGGLARSTDVDRSVERGTTGQNFQQKTLRKRAFERATRAGRSQSRESEAVKRQRRRLKRKAGLRKPTKLNR